MRYDLCHFYVDESGDPTLFNRNGKVVIGEEGCSRHFAVGCMYIAHPELLHRDLERLRSELLADPLLKDVPSMKVEGRKTALAFHAKDDLPEVRHQVFKLLMRHDLSFRVVIRKKEKMLENLVEDQRLHPQYRYKDTDAYDQLVRLLFVGILHQCKAYKITFARRGNSDRTGAFREALEESRKIRLIDNPIIGPMTIVASTPHLSAGLQAVDYFLWAIQRSYERGEARYMRALTNQIGAVIDFDEALEALKD